MNPARRQTPGRPRLLLVAAALFVAAMIPGIAGAGHGDTPPIPSYTGCIGPGGALFGFAEGETALTICGSRPRAHLSGGDITRVVAGPGLEGGASEAAALLRLGPHACADGSFLVRFGGGGPTSCGAVFAGNFGIEVQPGPNVGVALKPQTCDIQTLVNGIDADGRLVCVSPKQDTDIGFRRDATNNDLVIENPGAEFVFRNAASFDVIGIGTSTSNPDGNSFVIDSLGASLFTPNGEVSVGNDGDIDISNENAAVSIGKNGQIDIGNTLSQVIIAPDGELHMTGATSSPLVSLTNLGSGGVLSLTSTTSGPPVINVNAGSRQAMSVMGGNPTLPGASFGSVPGGIAVELRSLVLGAPAVVSAPNGVKVNSNGAGTTGVVLPQNGGSWSGFSDRSAKEHFVHANGLSTLELLAGIPITTWNYKAQPDGIRHMGPTAQDFYDAFGLGESRTHISTVDADGVALSAIQGLYALVKTKEATIARLEQRVARLERLVAQSLNSK